VTRSATPGGSPSSGPSFRFFVTAYAISDTSGRAARCSTIEAVTWPTPVRGPASGVTSIATRRRLDARGVGGESVMAI
jgi:hypothetical protein